MLVIVPNELRDQIYAKIDAALIDAPEAAADRDHYYQELLAFFNENGYIPDFSLVQTSPKEQP